MVLCFELSLNNQRIINVVERSGLGDE